MFRPEQGYIPCSEGMNELSYVTEINIGNCLDQDNAVRGPQVEIQGYLSPYLVAKLSAQP
jgi:hypothetical protein